MQLDEKPPAGTEEPPVVNRTEARQGVTGHKVRYVLMASLIGVVVAFAIIYIAFFA